jgi:hypothetical protein
MHRAAVADRNAAATTMRFLRAFGAQASNRENLQGAADELGYP